MLNITLTIIEWLGIAAFAVAGAMVGIDKKLDVFGVLICGITTSIGGGIIRDILLGLTPPRMFVDSTYLIFSSICSFAVFITVKSLKEIYIKNHRHIENIINVFDALGIGVFAVVGSQIAIDAGHISNPFIVLFAGVISCVGGGMLRDISCADIPFFFKKRIYALACIAGSLTYYLLYLYINEIAAIILGFAVTVVIRLLATFFKWNMPKAID